MRWKCEALYGHFAGKPPVLVRTEAAVDIIDTLRDPVLEAKYRQPIRAAPDAVAAYSSVEARIMDMPFGLMRQKATC